MEAEEARLNSLSLEILWLENCDAGFRAERVKKNKKDCDLKSIGLGLNFCLRTLRVFLL